MPGLFNEQRVPRRFDFSQYFVSFHEHLQQIPVCLTAEKQKLLQATRRRILVNAVLVGTSLAINYTTGDISVNHGRE